MASNTQTPIIIGVGEFKNRSKSTEDTLEPADLMLRAIHAATTDATRSPRAARDLIKDIDGVSVVASSTWPYTDLPGLLSDHLGIQPTQKAYSHLSGNSPVQLIDDAAQAITKGELEVVVVVGGEALASLKQFIKTGRFPPPWTGVGGTIDNVYYANNVEMLDGIGRAHSVGVPMQVYAMYENGLRAHRGQSIAQNHAESARLYSQYARVAATHPISWTHGQCPNTERDIATVDSRNRMICFPYPLLMNAFNDVNLAAACIVTSQAYAGRCGIPRDKWIFPLGGGRGRDSEDFWDRPNFYSSPAMAQALSSCLATSELAIGDVDIFDFYSCFPVVPKLACLNLGLSIDSPPKPITLLGGLTSFGGAGANYSMHAIAEMVRSLRANRSANANPKRTNGLVLANGGVTYENAICLSTHPRVDGTPYATYESAISDLRSSCGANVLTAASGEATIETYTVEYDRQNNPRLGHIVCRLKTTGARVVANHGDSSTLEQLAGCSEEQIGRVGAVGPGSRPGQNLFYFRTSSL
ncbi:hypothetical protein BJX62DRAFT_242307 [Aspergillus germanicus]